MPTCTQRQQRSQSIAPLRRSALRSLPGWLHCSVHGRSTTRRRRRSGRTRYEKSLRIDSVRASSTPKNLGDEAVWAAVSATVAHARVWLDDITDPALTPALRARTPDELQQRQVELDAILATAPADVRGLIQKMQSMAPLPFDELEGLLADLASAHHERQHWILQHWPSSNTGRTSWKPRSFWQRRMEPLLGVRRNWLLLTSWTDSARPGAVHRPRLRFRRAVRSPRDTCLGPCWSSASTRRRRGRIVGRRTRFGEQSRHAGPESDTNKQRGEFIKNERHAYAGLWDVTARTQEEMRGALDSLTPERFSGMLADVNSFMLREGLYIERDDRLLTIEYLFWVNEYLRIVATTHRGDVLSSMVHEGLPHNVTLIDEVLDRANELRSSLRGRIRDKLDAPQSYAGGTTRRSHPRTCWDKSRGLNAQIANERMLPGPHLEPRRGSCVLTLTRSDALGFRTGARLRGVAQHGPRPIVTGEPRRQAHSCGVSDAVVMHG